jgi:alpha-tubulin suppressor-like RCC1 family protein
MINLTRIRLGAVFGLLLLVLGVLLGACGVESPDLGREGALGNHSEKTGEAREALVSGAGSLGSCDGNLARCTAVMIEGGLYHSIALKGDGTVWAWGANSYGQLGNGGGAQQTTPVQVKASGGAFLSSITAVAAGDRFSLALKPDLTVLAWGYNSNGQLGDGTFGNKNMAVNVSGLTDIRAIAAGWSHALALKADGTVWAWGRNDNGQIGDGTTTSQKTPVQVKLSGGAFLSGVTAVAAGGNHSVALKADGTVWAWGANAQGEIGDTTSGPSRLYPTQAQSSDGMPLTTVTAVAAGGFHSVALKEDGTVWAWGRNVEGQLGDNSTGQKNTAVQVSLPGGAPLIGVTAITAGDEHTVALKTDGTVWAWGSNVKGQIGDNTQVNRTAAKEVTALGGGTSAVTGGDDFTIALKTDGTVRAWGLNDYGQIGNGTSGNNQLTPVQVSGLNLLPVACSFLPVCNTSTGICSICPCTSASNCASGYCVDGVCCDTACTETCKACTKATTGNSNGTDGICSAVVSGNAPTNPKVCTGADTCSYDGKCDGNGACRPAAAGTSCPGSECDATTNQQFDSSCDGQGICKKKTAGTSCGFYTCGTTTCKTTCASDADCTNSAYCDPGNKCMARKSQGAACTGNGATSQCATGLCIDGVCCENACTGLCQACSAALKWQGNDGDCELIAANRPPRKPADCKITNPDSCGLDGMCKGNGTCQEWSAGTACGASGPNKCSGNNVVGTSCDGQGNCVANANGVACAPFLCSNNACTVTCVADSDCASGGYCDLVDTKCKKKQVNGYFCGQSCGTNGSACESGHVADDYCCNSPCDGLCQACSNAKKGSGSNGYCGNAKEGTDPHDSCEDSRPADPNSCLDDGQCNGAGSCRIRKFGESCGPTQCAGNSEQQQICNGFGTCMPEPGGKDCEFYVCDTMSGTCKDSCVSDQDCTASAYCDQTAGTCKPDEGLGKACSKALQCASGFCVDGVCCDSACTGTCRVCVGTEDGSAQAGICRDVENGKDPDDDCLHDDATTCLRDGACNGAGSCRLYAAETSCGAPQCADATTLVSKVCSGAGSCVQEVPATDCTPYACETEPSTKQGRCFNDQQGCTKSEQCAPDAYCAMKGGGGGDVDAGGGGGPGDSEACVPRKSIKEGCSTDEQCRSGFCVDGVCCDTACKGTCEACTNAKKGISGEDGDGKCGYVLKGTPSDDCKAESSDGCGFTGNCNGFGLCELQPYAHDCGQAICQNGLRYGNQICNGLGSCVPNPSMLETCFPYSCGENNQCKKSCIESVDDAGLSDCVNGFHCRAGKCVPITKTCVSIDDCDPGQICDGAIKQCIERPASVPEASSSCDCRLPGNAPERPGLPMATFAALILVLRRLRKNLRAP